MKWLWMDSITHIQQSLILKTPRLVIQSIDLQVGRCGTVPPFVDLLSDDCPTEGTALLTVKPQSDAFITEYMLESRDGSHELVKKVKN